MSQHDYRFTTRWRVKATPQQVYDVLFDAHSYTRWWSDCYVSVEHLGCNDTQIGAMHRIVNRGFLPYTLTWTSTLTSINPPHGFTIAASGELAGEGIWKFEQDGAYTNVTFLWNVRLTKPWLNTLSWLIRPFLVLNHNYVMRRGEKHLKEEMHRRHS